MFIFSPTELIYFLNQVSDLIIYLCDLGFVTFVASLYIRNFFLQWSDRIMNMKHFEKFKIIQV